MGVPFCGSHNKDYGILGSILIGGTDNKDYSIVGSILIGGTYNKDYSFLGSILGSLDLGKVPFGVTVIKIFASAEYTRHPKP